MSSSGRGHVAGPLAPYAEGFREHLLGQGYSWGSAAHQIHLMAHLSRWLEARGLRPEALDEHLTGWFLAARRADGYAALRLARALVPLLSYLRGVGAVLPPRMPVPRTPADRLAVRFGEYLARERGLAGDSVRSYTGVARRFLAEAAPGDDSGAEGLTAAGVAGFVRRECARRGVASAKATVTGLRALLRFLYLDGQVSVPLAGAVPPAACWQLAALPRAVSPAGVARLMAAATGTARQAAGTSRSWCCWRGWACGPGRSPAWTWATSAGGRARSSCAARAAAATSCRCRPMPAGAGRLAAGGRPRDAACPAVFVRLRAPHGRPASTSVSYVVRRACARAGVTAAGAHRLRHSAAAGMLAAGGNLAEIGQVLRHAQPATTAIYAKADVLALSPLARPWPGGSR